jgi:HEAT repeat protein
MTMPVALAVEDGEPVALPFSSAPIQEMLRLLSKGVRAHQLYLHNNPTYLRALDHLGAAFPPIWEHTESFTLGITESAFTWQGVVVYQEDGPESAESLPWVFYKDGVRELRFEKGFETDDLVPFLDVIQQARRHGAEAEDLLVMLWERELRHLKYRYVDIAPDAPPAVGDFEAHFEPHVIEPPGANDESYPEEEEVLHLAPQGVVNLEDYDATLHFLDEREVSYLRGEVEHAYALDLRQNVVAILLDIFETQSDAAVREEIARLLDNMLLHYLSAAQFRTVAYILREAQVAAGRAGHLDAVHRDRLAHLPDRLSEPDALSQLLQSLDESSELPPPADLHALFDELRPGALATIFAWLARIRNPEVRTLLETAAERMAAANTAELVRLIGHEDRDVAVEAIQRARALGSVAAVPPLAKRMGDPDATIRLVSLQALAQLGSPGALQNLERGLGDTDRDVRLTAARALTARAYRPALERVEAVVRGKALRDADLTEKMVMFELYGAVCGDRGVPLLDKILNGRDFFRRHAEAELRACAASALGRIGSATATGSLQRASGEKDVLVRTTVNKALRVGAAGGGSG